MNKFYTLTNGNFFRLDSVVSVRLTDFKSKDIRFDWEIDTPWSIAVDCCVGDRHIIHEQQFISKEQRDIIADQLKSFCEL